MLIKDALQRIRLIPDTDASRVALFSCRATGYVDVVFAVTVETQARIRDQDYIGSFSGRDRPFDILSAIQSKVKL